LKFGLKRSFFDLESTLKNFLELRLKPLKIAGAPRKNDWNVKKSEKKFLFSDRAADRLKQFETLLMVRNGHQ
jgi:hypothetical protein